MKVITFSLCLFVILKITPVAIWIPAFYTEVSEIERDEDRN